mmetsp:Transcript_20831/g.29703  ORF Transcript_20831/g.29703 Transcript_20831/m.29703 type:complete len:252 (-) Transcript_20831:205-960(-)
MASLFPNKAWSVDATPASFIRSSINLPKSPSRNVGNASNRSVCPVGAVSTIMTRKSAFVGAVSSNTLESATSSSKPGGGLFNKPLNSRRPKLSNKEDDTPREFANLSTSNSFKFCRKLSSAALGSISQANRFPRVSGSDSITGFPSALRRSTSRASPRECAGSVDTTRIRRFSTVEASSTARADDIEVLPTPPFPPTKTVRGPLLLLSLTLISSTKPLRENSAGNGIQCARLWLFLASHFLALLRSVPRFH